MKRLFYIFGFIVFMMASSCLRDNSVDDVDVSDHSEAFINVVYKGLDVKHRFDTPEHEFEKVYDYEQLKLLYNEFTPGGTDEFPSAEAILIEARIQLPRFPYGDAKTNEEKLNIIRNDFPNLSDKEIKDNILSIESYYTLNLDYEVVSNLGRKKALSNNVKIPKQANLKEDDFKVACMLETFKGANSRVVSKIEGASVIPLDFSYVKAVVSASTASLTAKTYSQILYPNLSSTDTKRDAFRHVFWSLLMTKNYWTISNHHIKIEFSDKLGIANEVCGQNEIDGSAMDIHNNAVGRGLFTSLNKIDKQIGEDLFYELPTFDVLILNVQNAVENALFINHEIYNNATKRVDVIQLTATDRVVYLLP